MIETTSIVLGALGVLTLYSLLQWINEFRFNTRKSIKSFAEYGRKRGLLKLKKKRVIIGSVSALAALSLLVTGFMLWDNFYLNWSIILPVIPFNVLSLAIITHEISYEKISINTDFLDTEYFNIIDIEKNKEVFLEQTETLKKNIETTRKRINDVINRSSQFFNAFNSSKAFDSELTNLENQVASKLNTFQGSINRLKDNFVVIAQEYIDNQRKVPLNESAALSFIQIDEYLQTIQTIETHSVQSIVESIRKALKDNQLKDIADYPKLIEHLKTLNYTVTTDDVLLLLKNYSFNTSEERSVYLDIVYNYQLASVDFFTQFVIRQDLAWFINDTFYSHFKENDIKLLFATMIEQNAQKIVECILDSLNPKWISFMTDIVNSLEIENELANLIKTYDVLIERMSRFSALFNIEENFFQAIQHSPSSQKDQDSLKQIQDKDFSTPKISEDIKTMYKKQFAEYIDIANAAFKLYVLYQNSTEGMSQKGLFDEETIMDFILESIFRLNRGWVKLGMHMLIVNLFSMNVPWHNNPRLQPSIQSILEALDMAEMKSKFDHYMIGNIKESYQDFVVKHARTMKINESVVQQLVIRSERNRETLDLLQ